MNQGYAPDAIAAMNRALKPGGILGVVGHRGDPSKPQDPRASNGYVTEAYAIALIESAGFELVAKSEINANPNDTRDYEQGVWTLPPELRQGSRDRAKYQAIGESDRFTLKFRKR
jgi:predicted methyltransferase